MNRSVALLLVLALPLLAQDSKKKPGAPAGAPTGSTKYENADLGVQFTGIYGWEAQSASGSGAWTKLVRYFDSDYDAEAILYVRDNPYETSGDLKEALAKEFKEGGEVSADRVVYKDIVIRESNMRRGNALPGFEVEGVAVGITKEGKKRERGVVVYTYLGKNRLFRVHCTVRRSRLKKVRDLFTRAAAGLAVTAAAEKVVRGQPIRSARGAWSASIPEGFMPVVPAVGRNYDMRFVDRRGKLNVYVYAFLYQGSIDDQLQDLIDYYGDELKITKEETKRYGAPAFDATVTRKGRLTHMAAFLHRGRVYRVQTSGDAKIAADIAAMHEKFLKTFQPGN